MARKIFVNLPVKDLQKSMDFFTKLGFTLGHNGAGDAAPPAAEGLTIGQSASRISEGGGVLTCRGSKVQVLHRPPFKSLIWGVGLWRRSTPTAAVFRTRCVAPWRSPWPWLLS